MTVINALIGAVIGGAVTLLVSCILWAVRTINKTRSDIDIAFLKIRYLEDQLKEEREHERQSRRR